MINHDFSQVFGAFKRENQISYKKEFQIIIRVSSSMAQAYLFFYQIKQNVVGKSAKLSPTRASDMMMIYIYIWCWKTFSE